MMVSHFNLGLQKFIDDNNFRAQCFQEVVLCLIFVVGVINRLSCILLELYPLLESSTVDHMSWIIVAWSLYTKSPNDVHRGAQCTSETVGRS